MHHAYDGVTVIAEDNSSATAAVLVGSWGNAPTLLVKATKDVGFKGEFYIFYGNALGARGQTKNAYLQVSNRNACVALRLAG